MLKIIFINILTVGIFVNFSVYAAEQPVLAFSKAWYKPELIEDNDPVCGEFLKKAQDKFFENSSFEENFIPLNWTVVLPYETPQIKAFGKTFYLVNLRNHGCGGSCESNQALVSDKPFPENWSEYESLPEALEAPPAVSYDYTIVKTPENMFYLLNVGNLYEYKNQFLIYKLAPEARWKPACKILLAPQDIKQSKDIDVSAAVKSINDLNKLVVPISGGWGDCGSMKTAWRWKGYVEDALEEVLYRPWALVKVRSYPSDNSYGEYQRIYEQLVIWSLMGISQYHGLSSYKAQLVKSINDISGFYQKKFGWSEQQSRKIAEDALTSAISRGFGFYMYEPYFFDGEEALRKAILEKKDISDIKAIPFDVKDVDFYSESYGASPETKESILNIAVDYPQALQYLLEKGVDPNKGNGFGKTALMYAIQQNQEDSVKILLKYGANVSAQTIEPQDTCYYALETFKMTPLHYAVRYASPSIIRMLLDHGASPDLKAENHHVYPMAQETPLVWLKRYTAKDAKERNPNILDDKIAEVEQWLQPQDMKASASSQEKGAAEK